MRVFGYSREWCLKALKVSVIQNFEKCDFGQSQNFMFFLQFGVLVGGLAGTDKLTYTDDAKKNRSAICFGVAIFSVRRVDRHRQINLYGRRQKTIAPRFFWRCYFLGGEEGQGGRKNRGGVSACRERPHIGNVHM